MVKDHQFVVVCDLLSTLLRFRRRLIESVLEQGFDVTVICSDRDVDPGSLFGHHGIRLVHIPMDRTSVNPLGDLGYFRRLREELAAVGPNILFSYQVKAAAWAMIAARRLGGCQRVVLFPGLGYLFAERDGLRDRGIQFLARKFLRLAFAKVDLAFCQNPDDEITLREQSILPDTTRVCLVAGSGVSLDEFRQSDPPKSPIRFAMATRLLADKGIREFASVARSMRREHGDNVEFCLAGGFDTNPSALSEAEVLSWVDEGIVKYRGRVDDMLEFYDECSVFVLPSYYMEGTPRSLLEAMSVGRALITTDSRGCRETINGNNGFLVQPRSVDSLRSACGVFLDDPSLISTMGNASREFAREKFEVNRVCRHMMDAMQLADEVE